MEYFFNPKSVAVLGASSKPGKIGHEVLRSLIDSKYKGKIYPVNPKESRILNHPVYRQIEDVPEDIDLAVYILPANIAPRVVEDCGKKGVKRMVIISGGFKELGDDGIELERKTVEVAKKYGIRIIGPNCIGIFNGESQLDTFFQPHDAMTRPSHGNIAFLTQSGTYGCTLLEWIAEENMGVSKFVSYGNKCDVDEIDLLEHLHDDDATKVIAIYLEGLTNGKKFLKIAKKVSIKKPIVVLKAGKSLEGVRAAKSHTGALAGNSAVYAGALQQNGIILVDDLEEMLDVLKIISMQPLPGGNRIGMTTNGVGPCVVTIDAIAQTPILKLATLGKESIESLKEQLPPFCIFENPIDITGSADAGFYDIALKVLADDLNVDIIMPFFVFQDAPLAHTVKELHPIMKKMLKYGKPIIAVAAGGLFTKTQIEKFRTNNIPTIPTAKRVITALSKIVWYSEWLKAQGK